MSHANMYGLQSDVVKAAGYDKENHNLYVDIYDDKDKSVKNYVCLNVPEEIYTGLMECPVDMRNGYGPGNAYQLYWQNHIDGKFECKDITPHSRK